MKIRVISLLIIVKLSSCQEVPFINRWAFQSICEHIYDCDIANPRYKLYNAHPQETSNINPLYVKPGDIVFLKETSGIKKNFQQFFRNIHPKIKYPYILVTAGISNAALNRRYIKYIRDNKIIAWFGIHPLITSHPKLFPIPIGVYQTDLDIFLRWKQYNKLMKKAQKLPKKHLVYVNLGTQSSKRKHVLNILRQKSFCWCQLERRPFKQYLQEMATCIFTACPSGFGPDTYRVWEALLVGSIPIVKKTSTALMELYKDLPVLVINDWHELTQEFLEYKYRIMRTKHYKGLKKLYMNYWIEKIYSVQNRFRKNYSLAYKNY